MVRSVRPFAALVVCLSLVAITNAQGPNDRFGQFWGPHIQPAPPTIGLRGPAISTSQTSTAPVSGDMLHHWNRGRDRYQRARPHARGGRRFARVRRTAGARPLQPGDGDRAHRDLRRDQLDHPSRRRFHRHPRRRGRRVDRRRVARAAHDTLVVLFPSQKAHCDEVLAEDLARIPEGSAKDDGSADRRARRRRHPRADGQRWLATCRAWCSASASSPAPIRGSGVRIRSARSRWPSVRTGETSRRS